MIRFYRTYISRKNKTIYNTFKQPQKKINLRIERFNRIGQLPMGHVFSQKSKYQIVTLFILDLLTLLNFDLIEIILPL